MFVLCLAQREGFHGFPMAFSRRPVQEGEGILRQLWQVQILIIRLLWPVSVLPDRSVFDFSDGYSNAEVNFLDLTAVDPALIAGVSPHNVPLPFHGQILA